MSRRRATAFGAALLMLATLPTAASGQDRGASGTGDTPVLFTEEVERSTGAPGEPHDVARRRVVRLEADPLVDVLVEPARDQRAVGRGRVTRAGRPVTVELFDGQLARFQPVEAVSYPSAIGEGDGNAVAPDEPIITWHGERFVGGARQTAVITLTPLAGGGYELEGFIEGAEQIRIRPVRGPDNHTHYAVDELDPDAAPDHDDIDLIAPSGSEISGDGAPTDDGTIASAPTAASAGVAAIDVLVLTANGVSGVNVANWIAETNQAFINSGNMSTRVNLIHQAGHSYTQSASLTDDLKALRENASVKRLRRDYRADLVALLVPSAKGACGVAWVPPTPDGLKSYAYSVTATSCGPATFIHELGHNLGASHDPDSNPSVCKPYSYSCGHRISGVARSVMAYSCSSSCPTKRQFSAPGTNFLGTTHPSGTSTRDNRRSISNMSGTITRYYTRFSDVAPGTGGLPRSVYWLSDVDVTGGCTTTAFCPQDNATRAQSVSFLHRMAGEPQSPLGTSFSDVPTSAYYSTATRWARAKGITAGCTSTTFCPGNNVTRGQFVVMLYRFAGSPAVANDNHGFTDVERGTERARAVTWGKNHGIVHGTTTTTFSPGNAVTRAQIAQFLYRYASTPAAEDADRVPLGVTRPAQTF